MCLCLSLPHSCRSLSLRHTNTHLPACVTRVHTNKYPAGRTRVHTEHTHLLTPHSHSCSAPTRGGVCSVCVSVRPAPCACAHTGTSLHPPTFPLLPAEAVCSLILPCESGAPSSFPSLPSALWRPWRSLLGVPPEMQIWHLSLVVQVANGTGRSSPSCSFSGHFSLLADYSLLFVVDWAGCGWGFFGINCK